MSNRGLAWACVALALLWSAGGVKAQAVECGAGACLNGGYCTTVTSPESSSAYCTCYWPYTDDWCGSVSGVCNATYAATYPVGCENGGTCVANDDGTSDQHCACPSGWSGERCEVQEAASSLVWIVIAVVSTVLGIGLCVVVVWFCRGCCDDADAGRKTRHATIAVALDPLGPPPPARPASPAQIPHQHCERCGGRAHPHHHACEWEERAQERDRSVHVTINNTNNNPGAAKANLSRAEGSGEAAVEPPSRGGARRAGPTRPQVSQRLSDEVMAQETEPVGGGIIQGAGLPGPTPGEGAEQVEGQPAPERAGSVAVGPLPPPARPARPGSLGRGAPAARSVVPHVPGQGGSMRRTTVPIGTIGTIETIGTTGRSGTGGAVGKGPPPRIAAGAAGGPAAQLPAAIGTESLLQNPFA
jgi:EGF-like domain